MWDMRNKSELKLKPKDIEVPLNGELLSGKSKVNEINKLTKVAISLGTS